MAKQCREKQLSEIVDNCRTESLHSRANKTTKPLELLSATDGFALQSSLTCRSQVLH